MKKVIIGMFCCSLLCMSVQASTPFRENLRNGFCIGIAQSSNANEDHAIQSLACLVHQHNALKLTCQQAADLILDSSLEKCLHDCDQHFIVIGKIYLNRSLERSDKSHRIKDVSVVARLLNIKKSIEELSK